MSDSKTFFKSQVVIFQLLTMYIKILLNTVLDLKVFTISQFILQTYEDNSFQHFFLSLSFKLIPRLLTVTIETANAPQEMKIFLMQPPLKFISYLILSLRVIIENDVIFSLSRCSSFRLQNTSYIVVVWLQRKCVRLINATGKECVQGQ